MRITLNNMPCFKIGLIISFLLLCFQTFTYAKDITLEWDANTEPDLDHYVIYWGTEANPPYENNSEDEGDFIDNNTTTYAVTGLSEGTYYFAVKAFDTEGLESDYSNVVSADIPSSSGGRGGGGGCFIATAAFGSNMDWHVKTLSEFKDRYFATNPIGRSIVNIYYRFSPPIANYLSMHSSARTVIRYALVPISSIASILLSIHPVVILCIFIFLFLVGVYLGKRFFPSPSNLTQ